VNPNALTIAEEMSGMPGLGASVEDGGYGFDYRLAMGVPDFWIKLTKDVPDEQWNVAQLFHELKTHRAEEKAISYAESHDQALVGDKTLFFRLTDKDMYYSMNKNSPNIVVDRGVALHKIIRLVTLTTAGAGYLNFMGNEFGHPEWIDFPREGNNWSYQYARRQWSLADNNELKFRWLLDFDEAMIAFAKHSNIYESSYPVQVAIDEKNQVLIYSRADMLFVFNFNPAQSFPNYDVAAEPGKYQVIFSTDDSAFGGQDRIDKNHLYFTTNKGTITTLKANYVTIYVPSRTGLVLRKIPVRSVYDE
jgi:1,4-alpha-glucan branching enzyme